MCNTTIRILQLNARKSGPIMETAFQLAITSNIDIIVFQEPYIILDKGSDHNNQRGPNHSSFTQDLSSPSSQQISRVAIYISKASRAQTTIINYNNTNHPDFMAIQVKFHELDFQLLNLYNSNPQTPPHAFNTILQPSHITHPTLLLGDFNAHHPMWEGHSTTNPRGNEIAEWIDNQHLHLLNTPGVYTYLREDMVQGNTIDLSLATQPLAQKISNRTTLYLGSDHEGIIIDIQSNQTTGIESPLQQARYNTKKANWELFSKAFSKALASQADFTSLNLPILPPTTLLSKSILNNTSSPKTRRMDKAAEALTKAIQLAAKEAIP